MGNICLCKKNEEMGRGLLFTFEESVAHNRHITYYWVTAALEQLGISFFFSFLVKSHILTPYWFFYWTYPPNIELSLSFSQNTMSTFNLPQSKIQSWVLVIVMLTSDTVLFLLVASGHENMESWRWLFAGVGPNVLLFFWWKLNGRAWWKSGIWTQGTKWLLVLIWSLP